MFYTIHIPTHPQTPFLTPSSSIASDFRSWGYRVDTRPPYPSRSAGPACTASIRSRADYLAARETESRKANELMDLWNTEWLRRFCVSRTLGGVNLFDSGLPLQHAAGRESLGVRYGGAADVTRGADDFAGSAADVRYCAERERRMKRDRRTGGVWDLGLARRGDWGFGWGLGLAGLMGLGAEVAGAERVMREEECEDEEDLPRYERVEKPPPYQE